jgi:Holliday junction resolvasome RuvABC endonuclease subunit
LILAIDLGRHMGWILAAPTGEMRFGTVELEDTTNLGRYVRSMNEPVTALMKCCTAVAVEKPNTGGNSAYFAIRKNMAALGKVCELADFHGLAPPKEFSVTTGKLTLAGHGHADKSQMIAAAKERTGLDMNEHEADALGIWWIYVFGAAEPIRKARSKSSKATVVAP